MSRGFWLILACLVIVPGVSSAEVVRNADSPFGIVCPWGGIKEAGIKWVRCGAGATALDWGAIEKERGVFDWKDADNEVYGTTRNEGVDLLPILGYSPKWASSGPNGERAYPPKDLRDWTDFVYRIVERYKGKVKYWEVWNEEDIGFFKGTMEQYSDLLKSACVAARKADPDCKIVFGGTAGVNLPFVERVYQNGGKQYFDVMACHPYQWGDTFNDEWFAGQLRDLHQLMVKHGDGGKEIWLTELGWSTGDAGITNDVQARLLAQAFITSLTLRDANVTKTFWFSVKDWGGPGYGLIANDGSRKPAFLAYKWVTETFGGAEYIRPEASKGLRAYLFRKNGEMMLAAWSPDKKVRQLYLPDGIRWTTVQRPAGPVQPLTESRISVGPEPVVVSSETRVPAPKRIVNKPATSPYKLDVWYGIQVPWGTTRPYLVRGKPWPVGIQVHNDSSAQARVEIVGRIGGSTSKVGPIVLDAGESKSASLEFSLPGEAKTGLDTLEITGQAGETPLAPTSLQVRVTDGPSIEFPANSFVESLYLLEDRGSGAAPSVRFNGTWTYKFDLSGAKGGVLEVCVGANQANEWRVLLSSDQKTWTAALSGKSDRSRRSADVAAYAGGDLYVKFEGIDEQLTELVLTRWAL